MANRRTLLKAIETVRAGGRPPMALDAAEAAALTGPDTIDCIAPAGRWEAHWRERRRGQARRRRLAGRRRPRARGLVGLSAGRDELRRSAAASHDAARAAACEAVRAAHRATQGIELVRIGWCDTARRPARQDADRRRRAARAARAASAWSARCCSRTPPTAPRIKVFEPGADRRPAGLRLRQQPAAAARPGELSRAAVGAGAPAGCGPQPWFDDAHAGADRHAPRPAAALGAPGATRASACAAGSRSSSTSTASPTLATRLDPAARRLAGRAAGGDDDPPRLQPAGRGLGRPGRRAAAHRPAHRAGPRPAAALARDRARPEPGRGGVRRHRCAHRRRPDGAVSQRRDARRCAAPAITPASSAGRRSPT